MWDENYRTAIEIRIMLIIYRERTENFLKVFGGKVIFYSHKIGLRVVFVKSLKID